jgi:nicotinamide mononucleotide transporter
LALWITGAVLATFIWGAIMHNYTNASYPYWDAAIAMFSVAAQIMMTRRYLENWWLWIGINSISIPLYILKGLNLTAGLYGVFLVLAIVGLIDWRRQSRT